MDQHAVPQEIMKMEFKLFGNFMTLREFIFIAVSAAIAWFFYFLAQNGLLPGFIAYPLVFIIGLGGILTALVPYQDKTLDQWLLNFLSAVKKPTKRIWKKAGFSLPETNAPKEKTADQGVTAKYHVIAPPTTPENSITSNLKVAAAPVQDTTQIDASETARMKQIDQQLQITSTDAPIPTTIPSPVTVEPTPELIPATPITTETTDLPQIQPAEPLPVTPTPVLEETPATAPVAAPVAAAQIETPAATLSEEPATATATPNSITIDDTYIKSNTIQLPGIEEKSNTINIVLKDLEGKYIAGVVCLIKDDTGQPVRASVSNSLGQLLNNSQLPNGTYKISLTKTNTVFPEITWTLSGKINPPVEIRSL